MICSTLKDAFIKVVAISCCMWVFSVYAVVLWYIMPVGYRSSVGEPRCALIGVLQYARRARYGSWPEHFAWVRCLLMIFMAASAWSLLLEFLGAVVLWLNFHSVANSANSAFAISGPLSMHRHS